MNVTAILVTFNRSQSLANALESVAQSVLPPSVSWEVLVVDNNSTDRTPQVVEEFSVRYPGRFRYLFEPTAGKSHGLNAGIEAARGDIVAFVDDDVTVEKTWLQNLTAPLQNGDWAGVGGRILLHQDLPLPEWLSLDRPYNMGGVLAGFDLGAEPGPLDEPPYGTNMAFPKRVFRQYGGFRLDLGPRPGSQLRNEDTEFGRRLLTAGERLWYEPSAVVYHPVPQQRLKKEYFLEWWFDFGRAISREKGKRQPVWGFPRHFFSVPRMIATHLAPRVLRWIFTFNSRERFFRKGVAWMSAGQIAEIYRIGAAKENQVRVPIPAIRFPSETGN
jgi:glycosyltransferase involved in cell wall biosynthesis